MRLRLVTGAGFRPADIKMYGLSDASVEAARSFISHRHMEARIRPTLNDIRFSGVLDNKWFFAHVMSASGVPSPRTLGLLHPCFGASWTGNRLRDSPDFRDLLDSNLDVESIIGKPVMGYQGRGILPMSIHRSGDRPYAEIDGNRHVALDEVVLEVAVPPEGLLLQERVAQHPVLSILNPTTLNTVRLVTLVMSDGSVEPIAAMLRVGRKGNVADNWDQGGVAVPVDLFDGSLGLGGLKPKYGGGLVEVHPDSGARFADFKIPHWAELLSVGRKAATVLPRVRLVGWDIASTPEGPVIVEGNFRWEVEFTQSRGLGLYSVPSLQRELDLAGLQVPELGLADGVRMAVKKVVSGKSRLF